MYKIHVEYTYINIHIYKYILFLHITLMINVIMKTIDLWNRLSSGKRESQRPPLRCRSPP